MHGTLVRPGKPIEAGTRAVGQAAVAANALELVARAVVGIAEAVGMTAFAGAPEPIEAAPSDSEQNGRPAHYAATAREGMAVRYRAAAALGNEPSQWGTDTGAFVSGVITALPLVCPRSPR